MKLGCRPSLDSEKTLKITKYLPKVLPPPPLVVRWDKAVKTWGRGGNNVHGDCVTCTAAHLVDCYQANESFDFSIISDEAIIQLAKAHDALEGWSVLERLKVWKRQGMWGNKIRAYMAAPLHQPDILKTIINEFGGADLAAYVPEAWLKGGAWDVGQGPDYAINENNGHSFCLVGYFPDKTHDTIYKAISWGEAIDMTQAAVDKYVIEVWASINEAWFKDGETPSGFDAAALQADLAQL